MSDRKSVHKAPLAPDRKGWVCLDFTNVTGPRLVLSSGVMECWHFKCICWGLGRYSSYVKVFTELLLGIEKNNLNGDY